MSLVNISDDQARIKALDQTKSFIVQAPAGSGKTELLSQRVLKLLAYVSKPEEIVALTFTRKAAAEMRHRIISSLLTARNEPRPDDHKQITYDLAKKVLETDSKKQWGLLSNPARLNITTIDSLCAKIVKQTPVLSNIGGDVKIVDKPEIYYKQALRNLFDLINTDDYDNACNWTAGLKALLHHFECNYNKLQRFLLEMLYKREQWLPYIANTSDDNMHELMQFCWQQLSLDVTSNIETILPLNITNEIEDLISYAVSNLLKFNRDYSDQQTILINYKRSILHFWQAASYLLMSTSGKIDFRKRFDKRIGIHTKVDFVDKEEQLQATNNKKRLAELVKDINTIIGDDGRQDLINNFVLLRKIPEFDYSDENWKLLSTLSNTLRLLEAELRVIFKANKSIDFSGMSQAAVYALSNEFLSDPTNNVNNLAVDLNLYFDYTISHILVDEFQDTSYSQYKLLYKLISNWEDKNKTLFVVGDPMQSIYRFRQAEVGLFLQVKDSGIANVKLEYLALSKNFRSEQQIVDWVNQKFEVILPRKSNILLGAISYSKSETTKENNHSFNPKLNIFAKDNRRLAENRFIIDSIKDIIESAKKSNDLNKSNKYIPITSIAILVRNRKKVVDLILELKKNNINTTAVDIELLSERMVIKDLLSLTKSILDLSCRTSWYSVLRSPLCGLSLEDLYLINSNNKDGTIWDVLTNPDSVITPEASYKLNNLLIVYRQVFKALYKIDFYKIVKQAWYALGGDVIYASKEEQSDAEQFFELIFNLEQSNIIADVDGLVDEVEKLYSNASFGNSNLLEDNSSNNYTINIMTIHKSKGLQFDYVFLPYLDGKSKANSHQMLAWQEYHNPNVDGILLAPFYFKQNEQVKFYDALRHIESQKDKFELARLFYVAATRAIKSCVLTASLDGELLLDFSASLENKKVKINSNSILGNLIYLLSNNEIVVHHEFDKINSNKDNQGGLRSDDNNNSDYINKIKYIDYEQHNLSDINLSSSISSDDSDNAVDNKFDNIQADLFYNRFKDLITFDSQTDNPEHYLIEDQSLRIIGIFVHKVFYNIAKNYLGIDVVLIDGEIDFNLKNNWRNLLLMQGISVSKIDKSLNIITTAIKNTLLDATGRWLLGQYEHSYAEHEIYYKSKNKINKSVIDRIFIDGNAIWIIDYKTTDKDSNEIIEQYKPQLQHYGYLVNKMFKHKVSSHNYNIKLGLYFPLSSKFYSWRYQVSTSLA